jgi:hypothetical protein
MPNCRAAVWVLRLSLTRRRASALKASSYLRRLSGDDPLVFAVITEEIYFLLLSVLPRPLTFSPRVVRAMAKGSIARQHGWARRRAGPALLH